MRGAQQRVHACGRLGHQRHWCGAQRRLAAGRPGARRERGRRARRQALPCKPSLACIAAACYTLPCHTGLSGCVEGELLVWGLTEAAATWPGSSGHRWRASGRQGMCAQCGRPRRARTGSRCGCGPRCGFGLPLQRHSRLAVLPAVGGCSGASGSVSTCPCVRTHAVCWEPMHAHALVQASDLMRAPRLARWACMQRTAWRVSRSRPAATSPWSSSRTAPALPARRCCAGFASIMHAGQSVHQCTLSPPPFASAASREWP